MPVNYAHERVVPIQQDIEAAMQKQSADGNICATSHALPTMAIADFFHAHNISDAIVDPSPCFLLMLKFA